MIRVAHSSLSRARTVVTTVVGASIFLAGLGLVAACGEKPTETGESRNARPGADSTGGDGTETRSGSPVEPSSATASAALDEPQSARGPLVFGTFPFLAASRLETGFEPLVAAIGAAVGREVRYRSTRDYHQFMELLAAGTFDLAYVQPFDYVRLATDAGYRPLVARAGSLSAHLMVGPSSSIEDPKELAGRRVGFPPAVAAISYLGLESLRDLGLVPGEGFENKHFRNHEACLQQLLVGNLDACFAGSSTIANFEDRLGIELRRLAISETIPPSPFIAHSRLEETDIERCIGVFLSGELPEPTRRILGARQNPPLRRVLDADYEDVRHLWQRLSEDGQRNRLFEDGQRNRLSEDGQRNRLSEDGQRNRHDQGGGSDRPLPEAPESQPR